MKQAIYLPGDYKAASRTARMIRVNQAGELAAVQICKGQNLAFKHKAVAAIITDIEKQEQEHLNAFNQMVSTRQIRPSILLPLWHVAGLGLGFASALLGEKMAMACTAAVEEVIDEHYAEQLIRLENDSELKTIVTDFRNDELEHRRIAIENGALQAPAYKIAAAVIKTGCRSAIWLSTRI